MSAAAENEKKGPSKKELNRLARKEKRQGGSEAPVEEVAAVTFVVHVPKNQAVHPSLTRAVELLTKGAREFAVKYVAHNDAALGNLSALYIGGECIVGDANIAEVLIRSSPSASHLCGSEAWSASLVDQWLDFYSGNVSAASASSGVVEQYLSTTTFLVGHALSLADIAVFLLFRKSADAAGSINRFVRFIGARLPADAVNGAPLQVAFVSNKTVKEPVKKEAAQANAPEDASKEEPEEVQEGGTCPPLPGAVDGEVVTRFPPEPSGYLHIGHAKAVLLNQYYAQRYKGKLLIRFDDTNPTKEKEEFEQNILSDLLALGVQPHQVSHTSDHFEVCEKLARQLISDGLGYMDDTEQETMQHERMNKIESRRRNASVEENLAFFEKMLKGDADAQKFCLRAKIDMTSVNGTMRDPVLCRFCGGVPHHRTGTRYQAYPTYDFACPIVDSIEGVTHALRTTEYNDRDEQYHWLQNALRLRPVHIHAFGKMNFVNTVLSKRKLTWFVEQGLVEGWNDARFPTVQGCVRRGVDVDALKRFIISQGASRRVITMEWDKFWAENKRVLEEKCARYMGVSLAPQAAVLTVDNHRPGFADDDESSAEHVHSVPVHPQKPELGTRPMRRGRRVLLDQIDAAAIKEGEEVTLLRWGNVRVTSVVRDGDVVTSLHGVYLPDATNFSKTRKLSWLTQSADNVSAVLVDFDHLLSKAKIEEDEDFKNFVNPVTRRETAALVDPLLRTLPSGTVLQLERKGFFRLDKAYDTQSGQTTIQLFAIPDGKK
eukprot:gene11547-8231_t